MYEVEWTESEQGWGQRPDGYSYHKDMMTAESYISAYWARMPDGPAPDEYTSPGEPYLVEVDPVFALLVEGKETVFTDKRHRT